MALRLRFWQFGLLVTLLSGSLYGYNLIWGDKSLYLIGVTSNGHYQFEQRCELCHLEAFGQQQSLQQACVQCHAEELKAVDDSHPKSKFLDPRNASLLSVVDARQCTSCHREHRPEVTDDYGVTLPEDFCYGCHADIADDRASHANLPFDSCASAGCHNYHDNTGLYTDFLEQHRNEPALSKHPLLPARNQLQRYLQQEKPQRAVTADRQTGNREIEADWLRSVHAVAGVNCSGCHADDDLAAVELTEELTIDRCAECHQQESRGFKLGRHGMRIDAGLEAMSPRRARLSMHVDAHSKTLGCVSCHAAHSADVRQAAVESCLGCHADEHSKAYKESAHYRLWQQELDGRQPAGSGVSCASCHLPRTEHGDGDAQIIVVNHNQNDNLRPNEKMLRSVCMDCHGLSFSLDALADKELIKRNFSGMPSAKVDTMDMVERYLEQGHEN